MYVSIGREETIIRSEGPSDEQAREEESERERESTVPGGTWKTRDASRRGAAGQISTDASRIA